MRTAESAEKACSVERSRRRWWTRWLIGLLGWADWDVRKIGRVCERGRIPDSPW
jgi:hypothetical protein